MRIVFVNRFFHPDHSATSQMLTGIAFGLAAGGIEVHVVTSRQRYEDAAAGLQATEEVEGVTVHRVWTTSFGRKVLLGRALDYATFYLAATAKLLALLKPSDLVVAKTDPPLISVCTAFAAKLKRARLVNWQQDVFPEVAAELGFSALGGILGAPVRVLRNWSLRSAVANVALGERMAARLREIAPGRVRVIENYADGSRLRPVEAEASGLRSAWGLGGRFVVGYSGNMGRAHEFETFIAACEKMKNREDIAFVFVGGGQKRARLEAAVRAKQLANVHLKAYVPDAQLADSLGVCDVHLASLEPALEGLIVPSKFYGIAAAGRPTVYVGDTDGEVPRLLAQHDIGITVRPGDVDGLVAALLGLKGDAVRRASMGERARRAFEAEWDLPVALASWRKLLSELKP